LGQQLGCGAHLTSLTRLASGPFRLADAQSLETVRAAAERGALRSLLLPMDSALQGFPAVEVDSQLARKIQFGQRVQLPDAPQGTLIRAYGPDGRLLALLRSRHESQWQPHKVFLHPESHESHPRSS
jgi:tRNA pseudouridine55 synthase